MTKLLYINFIDMDVPPATGSSVRPLKMFASFQSLGLDLMTLSGMNNQLSVRRRNIADLWKKLKTWQPDMCYIEPPSGPMFYPGDLRLIRSLHRAGVPISLFYRDAYWRYPDFYMPSNPSLKERLKYLVIMMMQRFQWRFFNRHVDIIYFPSLIMAREFGHEQTLPPGAFIPQAREKAQLSRPLQFIFVGGAHRNYGTFLTLDAFRALNADEVRAKLFYICPESQWNALGIDAAACGDWLEVIHTSGDENLRPYFEQSDVALLTAPRTFYRDFAVPIKIFEYISYLKPILVTDCTETARIVEENRVGWVVKDDVESITRQLRALCDHPEQIEAMRAGMAGAREANLWTARARRVIEDLAAVRARRR